MAQSLYRNHNAVIKISAFAKSSEDRKP